MQKPLGAFLVGWLRAEGLRTLGLEQIQAEAASLRAPYYLTSAKIGDEVEGLFRHLGRLLVGKRC